MGGMHWGSLTSNRAHRAYIQYLEAIMDRSGLIPVDTSTIDPTEVDPTKSWTGEPISPAAKAPKGQALRWDEARK